MKKLYLLLIVMLAMTLVVGCGSAPAPAAQAASTLPAWFAELPPEDAVWGIGFAKLTNESLAMQTATTRAQRDAAMQISAMVRGELIDYANESGLATNPRSMIAIENIGTNLVNMNLSGATTNARDRMPDGTWYVRVSVRKADAQRQVNSIVNNEMADFAEFRADQALRRLETSIASTTSRPTGVGE
jgi:hypothetical protein